MKNILTLNKISKNGLDRFGERYVCSNDVKDPDAILVRSASMHEYDFSENTLAIARAGAGVNNIPLEKCSEQGIVVFNTPGANANAVKELVLCALFISSRKIVPLLASSNLPSLRFTAPVKAPFSWPNSSDSSRADGMAPQFTRIKGPFLRFDA